MKSKLFIVLLALQVTLGAIEIKDIKMELVTTFPVNQGENSFRYITPESSKEIGGAGEDFIPGPLYMEFINGKLVIEDSAKMRNFYLNENFKIEKILEEYDPDNISFYEFEGYKFKYYYYGNIIYRYDSRWNLIDKIDLRKFGMKYTSYYIYFDDTLFIWDEDLALHSISPLEKDKYRENLRNEKETIEFVKDKKVENSKWDNLEIDDVGRIFIDDILVNTKFSQFYKYWKSIDPETFKMSDSSIKSLDSNYRFLGKDFNKYYYWGTKTSIFIAEPKTGNRIKVFKPIGTKFKFATVNSEGDIFFFDYDESEARLYRINRQW